MNQRSGFTLIEVLVAVVVFAIASALAYGGLNSIARTRGELAAKEDEFRDLMRAVDALDRDLREAVARPVRGNFGQELPALIGGGDHLELTRIGFANPQAELRSNIERVLYELDAGALKRGHYPVLDRAPNTAPTIADLKIKADEFRLRYLDAENRWLDEWPPPQTSDPLTLLPRAVQWRLRTRSDGEVEGTIELASQWPGQAPAAAVPDTGINPIPLRPSTTP